MHNEKELEATFKRFDIDNTGTLDSAELASLCQSLGSPLTLNELESAILVLDVNGDGKITYGEFLKWYVGGAGYGSGGDGLGSFV
jgi:Ca2+-binding EF-hand superfamily protein